MVKDWKQFQHFKDRRPPWIKLYRHLLDDPEWHELDATAAKALIGLWLIASDDPDMEGKLPCLRKVAFRLRASEKQTSEIISRLSHWLIQDDIDMISKGHQGDAPEKRREETETEVQVTPQQLFNSFWENYPKKKAKADAEKAFLKLLPDQAMMASMLVAIEQQKASRDWQKDNGQYIPLPATWLRGKRWEDQEPGQPHNGKSFDCNLCKYRQSPRTTCWSEGREKCESYTVGQ